MSMFPSQAAASFHFEEVDCEKSGWVARITIKRPHNHNAYSTPAADVVAVVVNHSNVPTDLDLCPPDLWDAPNELGVPADPNLLAEGWVRRHLTDAARATESAELYADLGFEVELRQLTPQDLGAKCQACAASICGSYVMVYTRRKGSA